MGERKNGGAKAVSAMSFFDEPVFFQNQQNPQDSRFGKLACTTQFGDTHPAPAFFQNGQDMESSLQ